MAIAFVNGKNAAVANAASIALNIGAVTAGNCLILQVVGNQAVSSVSDTAGNSWGSGVDNHTGVTGAWGATRYFVVPNCAGNANDTITVTMASTDFCSACVLQFSGVAASNPVDVTVQTSSGVTTVTTETSPSFTPTTSTGVAVAFGANGNNGVTFTAGTNYTLGASTAGVIQCAGEYRLNAPASSQTASITISVADSLDIYVITLKAPVVVTEITSLGPERFARPIWSPEKTWQFWPAGPASQVVITPADPIPPSLPERWQRPAWMPERSERDMTPGSGVQFVFPETRTPIPPMLPSSFMRPAWNPEHTSLAPIPRPPAIVVVVPTNPIPPTTPDRWMRPVFDPTGNRHLYWPTSPVTTSQMTITISAPATVEINERFLITLTVTATQGTVDMIPIFVSDVEPSSTPRTMAFGTVYTKDIAGFGYMIIGTQPNIIQGGVTTVFQYEAVGFVAGVYTLTAATIGKNGNYYFPVTTASITVTNPS